jgi:hypothetical protein
MTRNFAIYLFSSVLFISLTFPFTYVISLSSLRLLFASLIRSRISSEPLPINLDRRGFVVHTKFHKDCLWR